MSGLRERQRLNRKMRILAAARDCFLELGYSATTIENVAERAEVSTVTIYNYYGTKGGVLLSIIIEGDKILVDRLNALIQLSADKPMNEAVHEFCMVVLDHSLSRLNRDTWRHVVAASMTEDDVEFGKHYRTLDQQLMSVLANMIESFADRGGMRADFDAEAAARILYDSFISHFHRFVAKPETSIDAMSQRVRVDIDFITSHFVN